MAARSGAAWACVLVAIVLVSLFFVLPKSCVLFVPSAIGLIVGIGNGLPGVDPNYVNVGLADFVSGTIRIRVGGDIDPGSNHVVSVSLKRVMDDRGNAAAAAGSVLLDLGSLSIDRFLPAGTVVDVSGRLRESESGTIWLQTDSFQVVAAGFSQLARIRLAAFDLFEIRFRRFAPEVRGLSRALLLGQRRDIATAFQEQMRRSGCVHVLALSGMHLAVLSLLLLAFLKPLAGPRRARFLVGCGVAVYVAIVGPIPSLVRSAVAFGVILFTEAAGFRISWPDRILVGVTLTQLCAPQIVNEIGFVYSAVSLMGIALMSPTIDRMVSRWLPAVFSSAVSASVAAFGAAAVVSVPMFGVVYPVGIIASAPMAFTVTVFMWCSIAFFFFGSIPFVGTALLRVARLAFALIRYLANVCGTAPALKWAIPGERYLICACVAGVCAGVLLWRYKTSRWSTAVESQFDQRD